MEGKITNLDVKDVRFPTSLTGDGSDAMVSGEDILNASSSNKRNNTRELHRQYRNTSEFNLLLGHFE